MKCDGEVSQRGKQEKQMQNGTVKLKKNPRAFCLQPSPEAALLLASLCTEATNTSSPSAEFAANLQSSEVLGVLHSSLLGLSD